MIIPTIIEKNVGYDIFSRLLKDRIIFVGGREGEVDTASANMIIAQLLYLDAEDSQREINLYINSPGGMVTAGLAIYDTMQFIKAPITTICMGQAMSFGAVLLAAGSKGRILKLKRANCTTIKNTCWIFWPNIRASRRKKSARTANATIIYPPKKPKPTALLTKF